MERQGATEATIAIIGTAGRRDDARRITRELYDAMYEAAVAAIGEWKSSAGVSGGAAVADHLCVRAFLEGALARLTLYLPAPFEAGRFVPNPEIRFNPGATLNRYHAAFSERCGVDSLREIARAVEQGAVVEVHPGFHRRNSEVAAACSHLIAFTFGSSRSVTSDREAADTFQPSDPGFRGASEAGLRDGGTAHTWGECWRADIKRHVNLGRLEKHLLKARADHTPAKGPFQMPKPRGL